MSDPEPDPWADLYADLGVGAAPAAATPAPKSAFFAAVPTGDLDAIDADGDEADDGPDGDADGAPGDGGLDADGQPKRRRRRRRRRGRKGDAPGVGDALAAANVDPDAPVVPPRGAPVHLEPPGQFDGNSEDLDPLDDDAGGDPLDEVAEPPQEETSPAAARELIADWNVPSWQEIVAGLYRPDR